jgi:segregation and condensation protein A
MTYKVKLDIFEGPFDLLVYLIENAEMSIYDIKISEITQQYIEHIQIMEKYSIEVASEFMVLAATLIEIKSKMLLPRQKLEGVDGTLEDPRSELVQRILEYKRFKKASINLELSEEEMLKVHFKPMEDLSRFTKEADEYLDLDIGQFVKAFNLFIQKKKKIEEVTKEYSKVYREKTSVEDKMKEIRTLIKQNKKVTFAQIISDPLDKYEVIITFISVLELIRLKSLKVTQNSNFGEIFLTSIKSKDDEKDFEKEVIIE